MTSLSFSVAVARFILRFVHVIAAVSKLPRAVVWGDWVYGVVEPTADHRRYS